MPIDETSRFPCALCGHQRTAAHCWGCELSDEDLRGGLPELASVVLATTLLQPFVQALVTKAGEDVWTKIRGLMRRDRPEAIEGLVTQADLLEVVVRDRRLVIVMPKRLTQEESRHLQDVLATLRGADGWFRVAYDAATRSWEISPAGDGSEPTTGTAAPDA
ncbi:hypothetical protein C5F59_010245 [Streptomyces sp. QL37]|uniref:hypothetical protein n=1 Tax=Streptomyces sp. QL37 TaxID=2093747 RepID=UPI0011B030B8|nr:hypothetical protein [Streptomyces sp. QL37]